MDWQLAIERNHEALRRVLAGLLAMAGLAGGQLAFQSAAPLAGVVIPLAPDCRLLPRFLYRAVLRLLRPAEAATRRLVVIAARGIDVNLPPLRSRKPGRRPAIVPDGRGTGIVLVRVVSQHAGLATTLPLMPHPAGINRLSPQGEVAGGPPAVAERADAASTGAALARRLAFPLFDPPRRLGLKRTPQTSVPRVTVPGVTAPFPVSPRRAPSRFDRIDATRLMLRLAALARVLDDLPRQARRFALWQARLAARQAEARKPAPPAGSLSPPARHAPRSSPHRQGRTGRHRRVWPLRAGRPPGSKRRSTHEIHAILKELHELAFWSLEAPDTS